MVCLLILGLGVVSLSQENGGTQRGFSFYTPYPHIVLGQDDEVNVDLKLQDTGSQPEDIALTVKGPEGWDAHFETSSYPRIRIEAVHILPGKDNVVTVKFRAKPPKDAKAGDYTFTLEAATADGALKKTIPLVVTYRPKEKPSTEEKKEILELMVDYPSLENPAGKDFEFEIQIKNNSDKDQIVELAAQVPPGWRVYFTPRWKSEQHISSIKVSSHSSEWIRFVVTPPYGTPRKEFPLKFIARAGGEEKTLDLKAVVTGTYELHLGSEAEVLGKGDTWNIKATAGQERHFTLYLWNQGSAPITGITFYASKPKDWEVKFNPEKLESLPPLAETMKPEKVDVIIKPKERAIPGDYEIRITAAGKEDRATATIRVTVGASMSWGWVGVAVIVVVVAGLTGIFVRLGRR